MGQALVPLIGAAEALRIAHYLGDENLRIETTVFIAMRQDIVGELAAAKSNFEEVIRVARALDNKSALLGALAWRGQLYFFQSEYGCACEVLTEALQLGTDLRHPALVLQCRFFLGLSLGNLGRISDALAVLTEVGAMARRNGERYWLAKVPNCIAWIHRELGDFDQALRCDLEGLEAARASNVGEAEINSLISLGYDCTHAAEPETALKSFREAGTILDLDVWCRWRFTLRMYSGLAAHHLSQGQLHEAQGTARLLLESATHYEARKYAAIAHKLLGESAIARNDLSEAETQLNAARNLLIDYPAPLVEWRIHSILGRLRLQFGDASAAEEFEKASTIVRMIASNIEAEKLRATLSSCMTLAQAEQRARFNQYLVSVSLHQEVQWCIWESSGRLSEWKSSGLSKEGVR